jgi:hypothetical protein
MTTKSKHATEKLHKLKIAFSLHSESERCHSVQKQLPYSKQNRNNLKHTTIILSIFTCIYIYGGENWSVTTREFRLGLTEDKMLRRTFEPDKLKVSVEQRKIDDEKFIKLLPSRVLLRRMSEER